MSLTFPFITGGTVSVNNGSTSLTGSGTAFLTNGVKAGDVLFILSSTAPPVPIGADASSNTALTLGIAFGGSNQSGVPYFIMRAVDAEIVLSAQREFIALYNANANLSVFAALSLVADKLPYANGSGSLALADFKAWGRSMLALTVAANKGIYFTDANTAATFDLTAAGRSMVGAADAAAQRALLAGTSGATFPLLSTANTFGAAQSISTPGTTIFTLESAIDGGVGPLQAFRHLRPTAVNNDIIGGQSFTGKDSAGNVTQYGSFYHRVSAVTDGAEASFYLFEATTAGVRNTRLNVGPGGVWHPSATGGDKGNNTINFGAVYDDNSLLTCMALKREFLEFGYVDTDFWDGLVPDRIIPGRIEREPLMHKVARQETVIEQTEGGYVARTVTREVEEQVVDLMPVWDANGNGIDAIEVPATEEVVIPETTEPRRHELAHRFKAMIEDGFDPRDPAAYIAKLRADEALPGMPTRAEWEHGGLSTGEMLGRLWLASELLALVVIENHERIEALTARVEALEANAA